MASNSSSANGRFGGVGLDELDVGAVGVLVATHGDHAGREVGGHDLCTVACQRRGGRARAGREVEDARHRRPDRPHEWSRCATGRRSPTERTAFMRSYFVETSSNMAETCSGCLERSARFTRPSYVRAAGSRPSEHGSQARAQ